MMKEACGICAVYNSANTAQLINMMLFGLQHRGQESAGISVFNGRKIGTYKKQGLVRSVFTPKIIKKYNGISGIGHVRYSTVGESKIENAQPLSALFNKGYVAIAHNGTLRNADKIRRKLVRSGAIFQTDTDSEVILHLLAQNIKYDFLDALIESLLQLRGAYSLTILHNESIIGIRDPQGYRPLSIGQKGDSYMLASETSALNLIDARFVRDVEPGEIIEIKDNKIRSIKFAKSVKRQCIFELIYFARPDSIVFKHNVSAFREKTGQMLAERHSTPADLVIPVPDSGIYAAIGYSNKSGIPLKFGLSRNHYIGRTFIKPYETERINAVKMKLNPNADIIRGKRLIVIDDSVVRGTTSKEIVKLLFEFGAKEVHLRIASPSVKAPCYYGIDTPRTKELIANSMDVSELRVFLGCTSLEFLTIDETLECVDEKPSFCIECFTG